jgi:putative heme-binding domain-containing protein
VDFRDPRRDVSHGRIWRVTAKGRPLVPRPRLAEATTEELLEALKAPEDWTRHQAKRTLKERGAKVLPALAAWVRGLDPADKEHEHHLLEALWTYQSLDVVEPQLLTRLLHAQDHHARAAATRVLSHWHARLPHPLELLAERVADDHPQVRLEAVRALGQLPGPRPVEVAMQALDRPVDKFLDYALWLTARELEPQWLPALQKGSLDFGGKVDHLLFALQAVGSPAVVRPLVDLIRTGKVPPEREESVLTVVAALGGPQELGMILDSVLAREGTPQRRINLLNALAQATRQRKVRPAGDLNRLVNLLVTDNEPLRCAAARATGLWRLEALRGPLTDYALAEKMSDATRRAALDGLAQLGGPASRETFEKLADAARPPAVRNLAVIALTGVDLNAAANRAVDVLAAYGPDGDPSAIFTAFLQHRNGAAALTRALAEHRLPADVARAGVRTVRTSGRETPALVEALTKAGGLTTGPRAVAPAELQQLVKDVQTHGNAARGEAVYRRPDLSCLKCHAIAGAGGQVGPDLASIGASAPVDYLIESILLPNKAIKENYHSLVITTKDGRLFTGIKVRETNAELVLRNAEDKEIAIAVGSIDERTTGGSLMPEGLADTLTRTELVDLVRFLSELGKVGPYAVSPARVVRRWQALETSPAAFALLYRTSYASVAGADPALTWAPAYSTVAGSLPVEGLPRFQMRQGGGGGTQNMAFVRCQLEATAAGKVKLRLNSAAGLQLWLDGVPADAREEITLDLTPGTHTLTVAIDAGLRKEGLGCELDDVPGSPARARIVGGK